MNNSDSTSFSDRAAEVAKEAYEAGYGAGHQTGYQAGYAAALAVVMQAAQAGAQQSAAAPTSSAHDAPGQPYVAAAEPVLTGIAPSDNTGSVPGRQTEANDEIPKTASGRAAPGAIKSLVRAFVLTADGPVTENDFASRYPDVGRPSRYMAFRALDKDGAIQKQGRAWVPVPRGTGSPDAGASGSTSSPVQGGAP